MKLNRIKLSLLTLFLFFSGSFALENLEKTLLNLLPQGEELPAWRLTCEPRFFQREDLFEYINGAADQYLQYGFRMVVTADYAAGSDSSSVTVEIYCMKSPLLAFGIFAAERSPDDPKVDIGVEGYQGANVVNFYKGPYYVKITSFALDKDLRALLQEMGRFITGRIAGEFVPPQLFNYFPDEDRVPASERYVPVNFLGQSYFKDGYRCDYRDEKCATHQLFLIPFKDAYEAEDAFTQYTEFLLKQKSPHRLDRAEEYQRLLIYGPDQNSFVFCFRTYIGGGIGAKCADALKMRMEQLAANLKGR